MPKAIKRKTEFWWASIAGADCEPVEVATLDGERVAYTCGCGDPFYLDRPDSLVVLVPDDWEWSDDLSGEKKPIPLERPLTPKQAVAEQRKYERKLAADRAAGIRHSWRGPR